MSNEEPVRSVPDEMFQQVTAKAGRQLPDALFGPPPARAEREEPIRSVPDELFKQVTARSERSLPDALFGPLPPPVVAEPEPVDSAAAAVESGSEAADSESSAVEVPSDDSVDADSAGTSIGDDDEGELDAVEIASSSAVQEAEPGDADSVVVDTDTDQSAADIIAADVAADSAPVGDVSAEDSAVVAESLAVATGSAVPQTLRPETADPVLSAAEVTTSVDDPGAASVEVAAAADGIDPAGVRADPAAARLDLDSADSSVTTSPAADASLVVAASANAVASQGESVAVATAGSLLVEEAGSPRPVESAAPRPVLLVIADSLAYYGPKGGLPADDPRIWPNMVAAELDWDVELIARIGWTCRDAYWALIGDPRVWAAVPRAGAVVFAVGGMDTLPSPLPTALREMIRYIRPPRLRRGVRATYNWLQPKLSKLGRPVALPPRVSVDYLEQSRTALNHLRPELPVVAVLPSVHKCDAYGRVHRGRPRAVKALQAWSGRTSVPLVDLGEAVHDDIESGTANPDGIHWGWAGHAAVATAMTKALQEVR
ncbi:diglucosylglycerate octanoyltransferase [Nocardia sp. XZ_19_231]|uniref:diglucosylglycerate octanoyltransferase n=1 Tax=Nocardia sp. XZ_19_231 TaxID=2769252 RepID=UPI001E3F1C3F|nr:diglucosylglycerate octanoyltransferase [Nocardia sp. XZ_19_231]